jgi:hypothetical protein
MAGPTPLSDEELALACGGQQLAVTQADVDCLRAARGVAHLFTFSGGSGAPVETSMPSDRRGRARVEAANRVCSASPLANAWAGALRQAGAPDRPLSSIVLGGH